jgi:hypothetical protein
MPEQKGDAILKTVRLLVIIAAAILAGCALAPPPAAPAKIDVTQEAWYDNAVAQLAAMNLQARRLLERGKADDAAAVITAGEPWENRLLSAPHPTLPAMEAVSDLDELYGRMLLMNRNYGWARMMFQKNLARWKSWKPETDEIARRRRAAEAAIAECDRRMAQ